MSAKRFMTQAEAREEIGIGVTAWREWGRRGLLPPLIKISGTVLIERKDFERWLEQFKTTEAA